jgi:hypothetical protein
MSHGKPMKEIIAANAACIDREIAWFRGVLDRRLKAHVAADAEDRHEIDLDLHLDPPALPEGPAPYASVVRQFRMNPAERLVLVLAYLPHMRPEVLDPFLIQNEPLHRRFTEFGGVTGSSHGGFLPTGETAIFLLCGVSTRARLEHLYLFHQDHYFYRSGLLRLDRENRSEPPLSSTLHVMPEFLERLTTGKTYHPPFTPEFPAQMVTTTYEWNDLVVDLSTRNEIQDIVNWVRYRDTLLADWRLGERIKPGFRSLFYGPPGTGKTLTAALLGKVTGMPVFRIDLSSVVSKYIGETEKNLASLFDRAENQGWILFFDEADSLFGKRTETRNSNDRSANQQVSYLLQRVEEFPGVIVLASNLRSNIDEAFARRFQSMIHFSMPAYAQRLRLWEDNFRNKPYRLASDVDLVALARDHELSGGSIVNVLRYACLKAVARESPEIQASDLLYAVRNERHKEGKFLERSQAS